MEDGGYNPSIVKRAANILEPILQGWYQPRLINYLLLPLSWAYGTAVMLNRLIWRSKIRHPERVGIPVIVVGNLTVGGTGKTPLVIALAGHLRASGYRPGIVSRGYGGRIRSNPHRVRGGDSPAVIGDEALLLWRRSGVPVCVCTDRVAAARLLSREGNCDVIISDDGLQHHRLQRDLEILVVDGTRRFGNGWCLPAGPLREPRSVARKVDIRILNKDQSDPVSAGEYCMVMVGSRACLLGDDAHSFPLSDLMGRPIHAVAGLGNPNRFFQFLEAVGLNVEPHAFPDHHTYTEDDFHFADSQSVVLMTEKDAVKCERLNIPGDVFSVPVSASLPPEFFAAVRRHLELGIAPGKVR